MASHAVAASEIGAHEKTLVAATVDTVTFANYTSEVEVVSDGADELYVRGDGTAPTVAGNASHFLPAGTVSSRRIKCTRQSDGTTVVKLISAGTPAYSVSRG